MTALLPCPFCGGEARYTPTCHIDVVQCRVCGAQGMAAMDQHEAAIAAWNRRAPVPGYRAGAEAMRERAAAEIDCGCSWRDAALAATNKGERFVACGNDPCGAIEARAIRALPIPTPEEQP